MIATMRCGLSIQFRESGWIRRRWRRCRRFTNEVRFECRGRCRWRPRPQRVRRTCRPVWPSRSRMTRDWSWIGRREAALGGAGASLVFPFCKRKPFTTEDTGDHRGGVISVPWRFFSWWSSVAPVASVVNGVYWAAFPHHAIADAFWLDRYNEKHHISHSKVLMAWTLFGSGDKKAGLFERMKEAVSRTRENLSERIDDAVGVSKEIDRSTLDDLEG